MKLAKFLITHNLKQTKNENGRNSYHPQPKARARLYPCSGHLNNDWLWPPLMLGLFVFFAYIN